MLKSFNGNPLLDLTSEERGPSTKHFDNRYDSYLSKICCHSRPLHARIIEFRRKNFPFFFSFFFYCQVTLPWKTTQMKNKRLFFFFFCPINMWKDRKKNFVCVRQKGMKSWAIVGAVDIPAHKLDQIVSSRKRSIFCPKTLRDNRPHANRLTIRQRSGYHVTYIVTRRLYTAEEASRSVSERQ